MKRCETSYSPRSGRPLEGLRQSKGLREQMATATRAIKESSCHCSCAGFFGLAPHFSSRGTGELHPGRGVEPRPPGLRDPSVGLHPALAFGRLRKTTPWLERNARIISPARTPPGISPGTAIAGYGEPAPSPAIAASFVAAASIAKQPLGRGNLQDLQLPDLGPALDAHARPFPASPIRPRSAARSQTGRRCACTTLPRASPRSGSSSACQ
jgi:hypothetical protein